MLLRWWVPLGPSSGGGPGLAVPPLLQKLPPFTTTPVVEVADTAPAAAYVTVAAATLETGPTGTGGRPPSDDQQRPLLSTPSTTAEVGEGDTAAAAALMSLKLGSILYMASTVVVVSTGDMFSASLNSLEGINSSAIEPIHQEEPDLEFRPLGISLEQQ